MSIDFNKAPAKATHYLYVCDTLVWLRPVEELVLCCADQGSWEVSEHDLDSPSVRRIPNGDNVNSPSHYNSGSVECIEAIKASMSHEAFLGYLKGNGMKYLWRFEKKVDPVEDLRKAQWYLARLVAEQEGK